jgi:hypothetical protein
MNWINADGTKIYERGKRKMKWYRITDIGKDLDGAGNENYEYRFVFESTDKDVVKKVNDAIAEILDTVPYKNNIQEYTMV